MKKNIKVAVVGGGLAGLTSAYRLLQHGCDVTLYEAKNRVGGRVFSIYMKNSLGNTLTVELGGQNITDGGEAIYLISLIKEFGLEVIEQERKISGLIYNGKELLDFNKERSNFLKQFNNIDKTLNELAAQSKSIGELINKLCKDNPILKQALITRMTTYEGIHVDFQSIYHNLDTLECTLQSGVSKAHEEYTHKDNHVVVKNMKEGNAILPLKLAEKLGHRVHLNKVLTKIKYKENKFELFFKDYSSVEYDFVILAVPASVYQNIDFSEAGLDNERLRKMQQVAYGANYKIACPWNLQHIGPYMFILIQKMILFLYQDKSLTLLYMNEPMEHSEFMQTMEMIKRKLQIEESSRSELIEITKDEHYLTYDSPVTCLWHKDPYIKGSYSSYSINMAEELDERVVHKDIEFKKLFEPAHNCMFFIGEHTTILDCIGAMEAAVESGDRIARFIVKHLGLS